MRVKVIGISKVDFKPKDSDNSIKGTNLFISQEREGVQGVFAEKQFIREAVQIPAGLKVGTIIDLSYNRYGKVDSINLVS